MYTKENHGRYPDRLEDLLLTQEIESDVFICPFTNDTPAAGPTTQAVANNLSAGGHLSFIYVGKGMREQTILSSTVVLYEPAGVHLPDFDSAHFLFGDGHVEAVDRQHAEKLIEQLKAGINPPAR